MPDDHMPESVFLRLTALEQSQELVRRAQFLDTSSRVRHAAAKDRHQEELERHAQQSQDHAARMAHLETLMDQQQQMQAQVLKVSEDTRVRIAQNEAMLQRLIDMQRRLNGH